MKYFKEGHYEIKDKIYKPSFFRDPYQYVLEKLDASKTRVVKFSDDGTFIIGDKVAFLRWNGREFLDDIDNFEMQRM